MSRSNKTDSDQGSGGLIAVRLSPSDGVERTFYLLSVEYIIGRNAFVRLSSSAKAGAIHTDVSYAVVAAGRGALRLCF